MGNESMNVNHPQPESHFVLMTKVFFSDTPKVLVRCSIQLSLSVYLLIYIKKHNSTITMSKKQLGMQEDIESLKESFNCGV